MKATNADSRLGRVFAGKYRVEEKLGSGGMCDVYRARHIVIDKMVALKVLKPELAADPALARQFEQEARAASRIHHPHAIDITDFGVTQDHSYFIVMELVAGHSLNELLQNDGPLPLRRAADIFRQICSALAAAHSAGVVHRDIKADNIILSQYDGADWVKVVDFGISKILEEANPRLSLIDSNLTMGTPRYMSPEQCQGKPVDARSDIYSLGILLYEMLCGRAPFEEHSTARLLVCHTQEPPIPLRQIRPGIPPEVEVVVGKALEKDPDHRFQQASVFAEQFCQAIRKAEGAPSVVSAPTSSPAAEPTPAVSPSTGAFDGEETRRVASVGRQTQRAPQGHLLAISFLQSFARRTETAQKWIRGVGTVLNAHLYSGGKRLARQFAAVTPQANRFRFSRSLILPGLAVLGLVLGVTYLIVSSQATRLDRPLVDPVARAERPWAEATANNNMSGARDAIIGTLQHWIEALQARDIDTHMTHYSNRLHTYYLKRGVSRSEVRRDRERAVARYISMREDLKNIEIDLDPSGTNAIATFDKSWNFEGQYPSSGVVQARVWLHKVDGNWLITGERDLKLYSRTDTLKWP